MKHPDTALERHPQWNVLKSALEDLVENEDITLACADDYVIGYLLSKLVTEKPVVVDWAKCDSVVAFYDLVLPQCGSPSWHGRNLNALNDSWVTGDINAEGPPYSFCFINGNQVSAELAWHRDTVEKIARESIAENGGQIYKTQDKPQEESGG